MRPGRARVAFVLLPVVLAAVVFFPITRNYFHEDDFLHLYQIANGNLLWFLLHPHGGHLYLARNAIFIVWELTFGPSAPAFYWASYLTHLVNVALLFLVLRTFVGGDVLACAVAVVWGVYPVHEGTIGWYSSYGHALATTIVLTVLWDCGRTVAPGRPPTTARVSLWALLALVAATCFGTGIGMAIVLPVVLGLLRPAVYTRWTARLIMLALPVVVVGAYVGSTRLYNALYPTQLVNPSFVFKLVRNSGPQPIVSLVEYFLGYGLAGLCFGFTYRPADFPGPGSYVITRVAILAALVVLVAGAPERRRQLLAFILLAVASYGMIAAGRAAILEPRIDLARAATQARYHYAASAGLILALGVLLAQVGTWRPVPASIQGVLLLALLGLCVWTWAEDAVPIEHYENARADTDATLAVIKSHIRAAAPGQPVYIQNRRFASLGPMSSPREFPGSAALFVIFFPANVVDGHQVVFLADRESLAAVPDGGRVATLLMAPEALGHRAEQS